MSYDEGQWQGYLAGVRMAELSHGIIDPVPDEFIRAQYVLWLRGLIENEWREWQWSD